MIGNVANEKRPLGEFVDAHELLDRRDCARHRVRRRDALRTRPDRQAPMHPSAPVTGTAPFRVRHAAPPWTWTTARVPADS